MINRTARRYLIEANRRAWRQQFGIAGDGRTDDATALQRAIDFRRKCKDRQPILPGVYRVGRTLCVPYWRVCVRDVEFRMTRTAGPALFVGSWFEFEAAETMGWDVWKASKHRER